jgi:hypothetical protein
MNGLRALTVIALAAAAQGCGTLHPERMAVAGDRLCGPAGNSGNCRISVTISDRPDGTCEVRPLAPDQDTVRFLEREKGFKISWVLETTHGQVGYRFPLDGIGFATNVGSDLDQPRLTANGTIYSFRNKHEVRGRYKYWIKVVNANTGVACRPLDPIIHND